MKLAIALGTYGFCILLTDVDGGLCFVVGYALAILLFAAKGKSVGAAKEAREGE